MPRWGIASHGSRRRSRLSIHPPLEVNHSSLCHLYLAGRYSTRVLLKCVKKNDQTVGSLVEHAIAGVCEPNSQLPQLTRDLRSNRVLRWRCIWSPSVQMLLKEGVDLRYPLCRESLDELTHRLYAVLISVVDRLCPCHGPSITDRTDRNLTVSGYSARPPRNQKGLWGRSA